MSDRSYSRDTQDEHQASTSTPGRHDGRVLPLLPRHGFTSASNQVAQLAPRGGPSSAGSLAARRKRASKPKVRSGCLTCKIRRVKCDERKPTCARCEKADVECDGYIKEAVDPKRTAEQEHLILAAQKASSRHLLPRPDGAASRGRPAPAPAALLSSNPPFIRVDQSDVPYYDLFRYQLIKDLGGSCQADFWSRIVLNESTRDPCIRESILAIGAISQTIFFDAESSKRFGGLPPSALRPWGTPRSYSTGFLNRHHKAALLHHVKAVSIYRQRIQGSSADTSPRSIIIMTLLLIAFEFIQGNMKNVDSLMGTGMRLLENKITLMHGLQPGDELVDGGAGYPSPRLRSGAPDDEMEDIEHLLPCLCLMAGFTHFFNSHRNSVLLMNSSPKLQLPRPGVTVIAKLQALWGQFFTRAVVHVMRTVHDQLNYNSMDLVKAAQEQEKFVEYIGMWNGVLEAYLGDPALDADARRTLDSIQIHRLLIHIVISCSLDRSEMAYDAFEDEFRELLGRVVRYLRDPGPIPKVSFTFSEGLTSPLAMIIAKCRNHELRMRGIHVLNNLSWRESAWDGQALVVGKSGVVLLEERGMDASGFIPAEARWIWMSGKWDIEKRELVATYFRLTPNEDGTPFTAQLVLDMDNLVYSCDLIGCPGRHNPFESYEV
ncbi:C6 zinc finger protein [Colletotrichum higginsianum IMI 349063]|uniref:C6 zinc finger protein n=3 Tax=Colletotrichum higginsianum TaxID=80884 RepID=A0A1B7XYQ1_COLHI|nr:C6 zinc finger protein [Colletotrichum higginsianum IMI 349063]OBR04880.1 C6 zinc finger protein [Colletotrichum higginsianum IMI 349063]TIC94225.1 putative transcriptional regulatory protein C15D4.02 [Colletotrichum higginsianum]